MIANLPRYKCAKNYQNRPWFDKVIAKVKWCSFFDSHGSSKISVSFACAWTRRNCGSDGADQSPSSTDAQLTDENTADDETWNETFRDSSIGDVALLRDPPNYYEAVQYLRQVGLVSACGRPVHVLSHFPSIMSNARTTFFRLLHLPCIS